MDDIKLTPLQVVVLKRMGRSPYSPYRETCRVVATLVRRGLARSTGVRSGGWNCAYIYELTPAGRAWLAAHEEHRND